MKRLILLICASLLAVVGRSQTISQTLNGYGQLDALKMIRHFKDVNATSTTLNPTSVWFRKEVFQAISDLLEAENKQRSNAGLPPTDGIRVYFAAKPGTGANINTVIIVSTYDTGITNPETGLEYHEDYYEHSSDAPLFKLTDSNNHPIPIIGDPCYDNTCGGGAQIYTPCPAGGCPADATCSGGPHYLTQQQCVNMAAAFGKFQVNTTGEWFDKELIKAIAYDKKGTFDGVRIYFTRHPWTDGSRYPNKDAFVLVTTHAGTNANVHTDYFDCETAMDFTKKMKLSGSDNGELCPDNCTLP